MAYECFWESAKGDAKTAVEKLKQLIHEGNIRRVVIQHDGRSVAEFPLTVGVVGAALAPPLAAIATIIAMAKDCSIHVERIVGVQETAPPRAAAG